jgi:hypothetical protein
MGFYRYQEGLIHRHYNQEGGWDEHLGRCRGYILKAVERFKPENVTILGSGWLLDLPLVELSERVKRITLLDIVHPSEVISQAGSLKNIDIREEDVTGGLIKEVWSKTQRYSFLKRMRDFSEISVPLYKPDFEPGMVISLNILTQLENLPLEYLKKKSWAGEDQFSAFRKEIQAKHIEFLTSHRSVLITDVQEIQKTKTGETIVIPTLRTYIPEGDSKDEWTWDFDLKGSDYYNRRSVMKVIAMILQNEK